METIGNIVSKHMKTFSWVRSKSEYDDIAKLFLIIAAECYQQGVLDGKSKPFVLETESGTIVNDMLISLVGKPNDWESKQWHYSIYLNGSCNRLEYPTQEKAEASRAALIKQIKGE